MIFYSLLALLWACWGYFIVNHLNKQITSFQKLAAKEDPAIAAKYDCFRRKDFNKWNQFEMCFCAVFLLPIRLFFFVTGCVTGGILVKLIVTFTSAKNPSQRAAVRAVCEFLGRICLYALGFHFVNKKYVNISDIDPSYPKNSQAKDINAPILVSNHASWIDIFLHAVFSGCPGFMSKEAVSRLPIGGDIARGIQCLFVKRESKEARDDIMNKLKERINNVKEHPEYTSPVLIFPEGTTSNGEYLLSFKKGAFCNMTPVHVVGLKYHSTRYSPAYDTLGFGNGFLFLLCQLNNGITIYDMGVYDPTHLNLKGEEDWQVYAGKVKDLMAKVLDMKTTEFGFTDTAIYNDIFYGKTPKTKAE